MGLSRVRREVVQVTLGDGPDAVPVSVEVRGVTAGARGRVMNAARLETGVGVDHVRYFATLVIETAYDPETGNRLFGEADFEAVNNLPAHVVQHLSETAERLSGLGATAEDALEKNSGATQSVATDSVSLSA